MRRHTQLYAWQWKEHWVKLLNRTSYSYATLYCSIIFIGMGAISTVTSFKITGIGFPMASLRWGKRKVWMYLLPVIAWSIVVNIPEIYTTVAYFTDIKVNINYLSISRKYLLFDFLLQPFAM